MRYLLLIYGDEGERFDAPPEAATEMRGRYRDYTAWLVEQGLMRAGEALESTATATTVRVREGERLVTDGPFAETREQLGGFYLIECASLDEALEAAGRMPGAAVGSVEIRPIMELPA